MQREPEDLLYTSFDRELSDRESAQLSKKLEKSESLRNEKKD